MGDFDDLLRRSFIAIATDHFDAEATFPPLDVQSEVAVIEGWLCDEALADRRFERTLGQLANRPSSDEIREGIADTKFGDADAVVVYLTGHGKTDKGRHRIVLAKSDPTRLASTSLDTVNLLEWLAEHPGLDNVLLIIDVCQAGQVAGEVTTALDEVIPPQWIVWLSTNAHADAKVGALTDVVHQALEEIREGSERNVSARERYLESHNFAAHVHELLKTKHGQQLRVLREPYSMSCCLPNPRYDPVGGDRVPVAPARADLAILEQDMSAHWVRRAPVAPEAEGPPWLFTGRTRLMKTLIDAAIGVSRSVVVTGRAGSGKSAVLSRLVTCSDPDFRAEYRELLLAAEPVPEEGAVDIAVLATGKGPEQVAAQIGGALDRAAVPQGTETALEAWVREINETVGRRAERLTVVVDALDESSDPLGVVRSVLQRVNPPDNARMNLIVGVRSIADEAGIGEGARDLAELTVEALGAESIAVDHDDYWETGDMQSVIARALTAAPSPYAEHEADALEVAAAIEKRVGRSYLLAKLVTGELASRAERIGAGHPELESLLAGGLSEAVRQELRTSFAKPAKRDRAVVLLRATALAFGRGLPWRDVWPVLGSAIAPEGVALGDGDIEELLTHPIAGYLVRDLEDGVTVYRPFHDALRESLANDVGSYAAERGAHPGASEAHSLIATTLLPRFEDPGGRPPPPYARRHLVEHAAAAGKLDETFLTPTTLPFLDAYALSRALRLVEAAPHSRLGLLLGAWRGVRHRWSWERPESNAAALDVAMTAAGDIPAKRERREGLSWTPRWAEWLVGGTVVGAESRGLQAIAFGTVAGRACLVTAGYEGSQIWDAATSEPLGPAVPVEPPRRVAIAPTEGGAIVAAAGQSGVQAWDALTGAVRWTHAMAEGGPYAQDPLTGGVRWIGAAGERPYALATGSLDGRGLVAVGTAAGRVHLFDAGTGEPLIDAVGDGKVVRALAISADAAGRTRLVAGRGSGRVEQWFVDAGPAGVEISPGSAAIDIGDEVNGVAAISYHDIFVIAVGSASGTAQLWNGDSGKAEGPSCTHSDEVRGVALAESSGALLMASGSFDQQAVVWSPFGGSPSTDAMPHPSAVLDVAFGIVDGRLMLATACADSNARLWDAIKPSAKRRSVTRRILHGAAKDRLIAGTAEDGAVYVWRGDDGQLLQSLDLPRVHHRQLKTARPSPRAIALGRHDDHMVVAATTSQLARAWEVESGELIAQLSWQAHSLAQAAIGVDDPAILVARVADDGRVEVVDMLGDVTRFSTPAYEALSKITFLAHERGTVVAISANSALELLDAEDGRPRWPAIESGFAPVVTLGKLGDADVLAFTHGDGVQLWNLSENVAYGPGVQHTGAWSGLEFLDLGGRDVLISGHTQTVRVWHPRTGRLLSELPFGTTISSIAVSGTEDGSALVAVSGPGVAVAELT
jgi:WD40 repeat protein